MRPKGSLNRMGPLAHISAIPMAGRPSSGRECARSCLKNCALKVCLVWLWTIYTGSYLRCSCAKAFHKNNTLFAEPADLLVSPRTICYDEAVSDLPAYGAPKRRALVPGNAQHWRRSDAGLLPRYWSIRYSPNMFTLARMLHFPLKEYALRHLD